MGAPIGIPCTIMRGGTSKCIVIRKRELPEDPALRDRMILAIFGSPDIRQIDGLGGADSLTSKLVLIGEPTRPDADVDYTFGQVSIATPLVDYGGNCGNCSASVGPYAIDKGLAPAKEPVTQIRIHQTNTRKLIVAHVPVREGRVTYAGRYRIDGVPGTGAEIKLEFLDPGGSLTGRLLPTGQACETLVLDDGRRFTASIVDAANPVVFLLAEELGVKGTELPDAVNANAKLLEIGIVRDRREATKKSPGFPKVAFVSPPQDYTSISGTPVRKDEIHVTGRIMSMQKLHKAYAITGGIPSAAAAVIPGSVVNQVCRKPEGEEFFIGHPSGTMKVAAAGHQEQGAFVLDKVVVGRTARKILDGTVYLPEELSA
ncbi:MAG: 3-methylitaconate isomerase [Deltaproteobacteria bacterium]|nr:3-methylitaconate isomerase [Deltaproteobacteria bacterium]